MGVVPKDWGTGYVDQYRIKVPPFSIGMTGVVVSDGTLIQPPAGTVYFGYRGMSERQCVKLTKLLALAVTSSGANPPVQRIWRFYPYPTTWGFSAGTTPTQTDWDDILPSCQYDASGGSFTDSDRELGIICNN
jgi:hypothetical protein